MTKLAGEKQKEKVQEKQKEEKEEKQKGGEIYKLNNIEDSQIERINNLFNNYNYSLLIDKSKFSKEEVYQLPYDNTQTSIERNIVAFTYCINNSSLKLIIEGVYENNVFNNNNENKYHAFSPINFYFTDFIIDDLNVFLSVLN